MANEHENETVVEFETGEPREEFFLLKANDRSQLTSWIYEQSYKYLPTWTYQLNPTNIPEPLWVNCTELSKRMQHTNVQAQLQADRSWTWNARL